MRSIALILLILALPVFILMLNLNLQVYNEKFYLKEFEKDNVYDNVGKDLAIENTKLLFGYFKNKNDLDLSFFNEKEKLHLVDVKNLLNTSRILLYFSIGILILAITYLIYKKDFDGLNFGLIIGNIVAFVILAFLVLISLFDFGSLFLNFHLGVFSNDLWQLNPATDKLIQMFPEEFFFDAFMNILINSFVVIITVFGILFIVRKILRHYSLKEKFK